MNLTSTLLVLSTVTLIVSCGGESEPSLDDYFAELEVTVNEFITASDEVAVEHGFLVNFDDVAGTVAGFEVFLPAMAKATEAFLLGLEALDPPQAASVHHSEAVAALHGFLGTAAAVLDDLPSITDSRALTPVYETYAAAGTGISDACRALQRVADEHGVRADLRC